MTSLSLCLAIDGFIRTQTDSNTVMLKALTELLCSHLALSRKADVSPEDFKTVFLTAFEARLDAALDRVSAAHASRHN